MEVLHPRCAGLDVHSRRVNACVRIAAGRKATAEHREFATTTAGLLELAAWLTEADCTHVAMEATGVYWKPVWHILEDESSLTLVLANAQHIRNVPGRKRPERRAWIADLLAHGLIRVSFVPPAPIQELRPDDPHCMVREIARTATPAEALEPRTLWLTRNVTRTSWASAADRSGGAHRGTDSRSGWLITSSTNVPLEQPPRADSQRADGAPAACWSLTASGSFVPAGRARGAGPFRDAASGTSPLSVRSRGRAEVAMTDAT